MVQRYVNTTPPSRNSQHLRSRRADRGQVKELTDAAKSVKVALPEVKKALCELPDDERAIRVLVAFDRPSPDFDDLDTLIAGTPEAEAGLIARLCAEATAQGPDLDEVDTAIDSLSTAITRVEDLRGPDAKDARHHTDLLT